MKPFFISLWATTYRINIRFPKIGNILFLLEGDQQSRNAKYKYISINTICNPWSLVISYFEIRCPEALSIKHWLEIIQHTGI